MRNVLLWRVVALPEKDLLPAVTHPPVAGRLEPALPPYLVNWGRNIAGNTLRKQRVQDSIPE